MIEIQLTDTVIDITEPIRQPSQESVTELFKTESFNDYLRTLIHNKVLIVVNDASRATPTSKIVRKLCSGLDENKIGYVFLIATGSHKNPSSQEFLKIFGDFFKKIKSKIRVHNAKDSEQLYFLGKTSFGTPIFLNSTLFNEKWGGLIVINSIEPHYFAGWTGGRKSIVPGLAGYETITWTHKHALSSASKICRLKGNPVHDDLQEGFEMFLNAFSAKIFSIQFIVDSESNIHRTFVGDSKTTFTEGVEFAKNVFQVPCHTPEYELVIALVYPPLDRSFYQAHKALENAKAALHKKKSVFILVAACNEGIGPVKFLEPFKQNPSKNQHYIKEWITNNYHLGYHKAAKLIEAREYSQLFLFSELDKTTTSLCQFRKIEQDLDEFINDILRKYGIKRILLIKDAGITVPVLK